MHAEVACAIRKRAWSSRDALWLLARLHVARSALPLPQEAPRTADKVPVPHPGQSGTHMQEWALELKAVA